jgi:hypothetical protein
VWDTEASGASGVPLQGHIGHGVSVAISSDGNYIVSVSSDQTRLGYENWEGIRHPSPRAYRLGFVCWATRCVQSRRTPSSLNLTEFLPGDGFPNNDQLDLHYFANGTSWLRRPHDDISWPVINIQCAFCTDFGLRSDVIRSAVNLELRMLFVMAGCCEVVDKLHA